jgi:hypothetical protein
VKSGAQKVGIFIPGFITEGDQSWNMIPNFRTRGKQPFAHDNLMRLLGGDMAGNERLRGRLEHFNLCLLPGPPFLRALAGDFCKPFLALAVPGQACLSERMTLFSLRLARWLRLYRQIRSANAVSPILTASFVHYGSSLNDGLAGGGVDYSPW